MHAIMLVLSATPNEAVNIKSDTIKYLIDLFPSFVAIMIAVVGNFVTNKRNEDAKTIAFLQEGIGLYSKLQVEINDLYINAISTISFLNQEKRKEYDKTELKVYHTSQQCKMWNDLQHILFKDNVLKDIDVTIECKKVSKKLNEIEQIILIDIKHTENVQNDMRTRLKKILKEDLNNEIHQNKKILIDELKKFYTKKRLIKKAYAETKNVEIDDTIEYTEKKAGDFVREVLNLEYQIDTSIKNNTNLSIQEIDLLSIKIKELQSQIEKLDTFLGIKYQLRDRLKDQENKIIKYNVKSNDV